jgi:hypothetical protein
MDASNIIYEHKKYVKLRFMPSICLASKLKDNFDRNEKWTSGDNEVRALLKLLLFTGWNVLWLQVYLTGCRHIL